MAKICKDVKHTFQDYPTKSDSAIIIYFYGCDHNCDGCHSKELLANPLDDNYIEVNSTELYKFIKYHSELNLTNKIIFQGGDPLYISNINTVRTFLEKYGQEFEVCIYSGYPFHKFIEFNIDNFKYVKLGNYKQHLSVNSEKTDEYFQLASTNQIIIDEKYNVLTKNGRYYFNNN